MSSGHSNYSSEGDDSDFVDHSITHRRKRRRLATHKTTVARTAVSAQRKAAIPVDSLFSPLLAVLEGTDALGGDSELSFDQLIEPLLLECAKAVLDAQEQHAFRDIQSGQLIHPMSRVQARRIQDEASTRTKSHDSVALLISRKLKLEPSPLRTHLLMKPTLPQSGATLSPLPVSQKQPTPNPDILDALYAIKTTPYASSFLSRLQGFQPSKKPGVMACDWEVKPPWIQLMGDIIDHYTFMHPERDHPLRVEAPIEYSSLRADHLNQVHELLNRSFWSGIDVSDSLQHSPEQCTVVATYKKLVVGVAILSSPQETYITYLVVKPGFDNAQIATVMLYHLIVMNPHKDFTLHVSTTNPAMLLYNRFGFKAEEFIVGFYEDYIETQTRGSKNAFRLRLRQ